MTTTTPLRYIVGVNERVLPEETPPDFRFRYVDISQVDGSGTVTVPKDSVTFEAAPSRARRLAEPGFTVVSTVRTYLRSIGTVPSAESDPLVFSTGFAVLRPAGVDPRFLGYACRSDAFVHQVVARSNGVSYPAINPSELVAIHIPTPDVEIQRRIANFLDDRVARIDQIIAARRSQELSVDESFAAQRRGAVIGHAEPTSATGLPWADQASTGRPVRRLSQVARMGTGHTPSRSEPSYWVDCDIPWLTTSDVHRFRRDEIDRIGDTAVRISTLGLANSAAVLHPAGTVALSRTASAGFSIVMDHAMATSQDFVTWTCGPDLRPDFLLHTLRVMRPFLLGNLATGSTHKTIYFPDLMDLRVLLPSVDEQDRAVRQVQEAAARRSNALLALGRQVELLKEYKQSMITAAVTGELDATTAGSGIPG